METEIQRLLHELRESLSAALADSPRFGEQLEALRKQGFQVQVSVDCRRTEAEEDRGVEDAPRPIEAPVAFRMSTGDLRFLRDLGIDPTRSTRGLRRQRSREGSKLEE